MTLNEAVESLERAKEGQQVLLDAGLLPRVMEEKSIECVAALTMVINYVRDTEDAKKIRTE